MVTGTMAVWRGVLVIGWGALLVAGCHRSSNDVPTAVVDHAGKSLFVDITDEANIHFSHRADDAEKLFFPAIMSPGCGFVDFDQDGDLDIVLVDSCERTVNHSEETPPGRVTSRLFRQDANRRFTDITSQSGLLNREYAMGVAIGDVNNDGYPDVYFTNYGRDRLFLNKREGTFDDVTAKSGIDNVRWAASAAFFDYDRDGWLDLFVTNYVDYDQAQPCYTNNGQQDFCNPALFPRTADKLYHNVSSPQRAAGNPDADNGSEVRFDDVSLSSGIALKPGAGLGVVCADFNADNWPDVYVANDGHANFLWINQRDGTFREGGVLSGVAYDNLGRGQGSMGIAMGDVNADQLMDLLVTNLDGESNALYLGSSTGIFAESSAAAGLGSKSFPRTGFGTVFFDVEHDGDLDLFVVNGRVRRAVGPAMKPDTSDKNAAFWKKYIEPNQLFINAGNGRFVFYDTPQDAFSSKVDVSRGLAMGDVDNDGDLDVLVTATGAPASLLRNDSAKRGHWLMVRAVDPRYGGRDAYGARITIVAGQRRWTAIVNPAGSYLTSHDPRAHFGLGHVSLIDAIQVTWPDGEQEMFLGGQVDQLRELAYGTGQSE